MSKPNLLGVALGAAAGAMAGVALVLWQSKKTVVKKPTDPTATRKKESAANIAMIVVYYSFYVCSSVAQTPHPGHGHGLYPPSTCGGCGWSVIDG